MYLCVLWWDCTVGLQCHWNLMVPGDATCESECCSFPWRSCYYGYVAAHSSSKSKHWNHSPSVGIIGANGHFHVRNIMGLVLTCCIALAMSVRCRF
jgi:hypothetical protein